MFFQSLSQWESAEPLFCSEKLSSFSLQKTKQKPDLQFWAGKLNISQLFAGCSKLYISILPKRQLNGNLQSFTD